MHGDDATNNDATSDSGRPWIEYRTDGNGPRRVRSFDTVEQAQRWAHWHLGADVADVGTIHVPEPDDQYPGLEW